MGIMAIAMHPKSVLPQWYVSRANICSVNSGNAIPMRLPARRGDGTGASATIRLQWERGKRKAAGKAGAEREEEEEEGEEGRDVRQRLCPASAEDAKMP